jgi:hypothetical protein
MGKSLRYMAILMRNLEEKHIPLKRREDLNLGSEKKWFGDTGISWGCCNVEINDRSVYKIEIFWSGAEPSAYRQDSAPDLVQHMQPRRQFWNSNGHVLIVRSTDPTAPLPTRRSTDSKTCCQMCFRQFWSSTWDTDFAKKKKKTADALSSVRFSEILKAMTQSIDISGNFLLIFCKFWYRTSRCFWCKKIK